MTERSAFANEFSATIRLGLPIVTVQLANMALGFLDTTMAGRISPADLGAIAAGRSLYTPIYILALGILLAINPIVAQLKGNEKPEQVGGILKQGIWLAILCSIPGVLLVRNTSGLLGILEVDPTLIPIVKGYLEALGWGLPATLIYLAVRFMNEGVLESRPGMYSAILAVPLNFVLNYLLMFGAMGFPKMGAVGAGWATCIVWWVLAIGFWTFTYTRKKYQQYALWGPFEWPRWEVMRTMLGIGLPNGMSLALEVSMFALTALLIATLGIVELASHQVALNFASITFMIPLGFSIATTSRVGFMAGKGDLDGVRTAGHVGIALCTAVMVVTALIMILFPGWIVRIYTSDPVVMSLASQLLVLAGIFQVSDGLQVSASSALRGLKDTRIPMYVNLLSYWGVGLPLGYYLGIMRGWGVQGFWIGLIGGLTVAAFFHPFRFQRLTRAMARERADN